MTILLLFAAIAAAAAAPAAPGTLSDSQRQRCQRLGPEFARGGTIKVHRAYTGSDGRSKIEITEMRGSIASFYGGSITLTQYGLGDPTKVVVVYGHPNLKIAAHPSPYREIFLIVSGSSVVELPDGTEHELTPGSMLLAEDQKSGGRGGRSGPCGYVAIDLQFKDAPRQ